ncbi:hypothetical protein ABZ070_05570 [Streptomyces sp. NPDC006283]|uniref:hypothetical protein n=1 Tax=Streptomyces sp. NPDC006283 TaxID=3156741 RepID=UPI0033B6AB21
MSDEYRPEGFEDSDEPLPRDMPDQQAGAEDPWDAEDRTPGEPGRTDEKADDVPDIDEAGAGPQGATPADEQANPEMPTPDESPG